MAQLAVIFLNVLVPVFLLVGLGYLAGPRLGLDSRTLSRFAYFILIPAYVFDVLSTAQIGAALAGRMAAFAVAVHLGCAGAGYLVARALRRPPQMLAAYILIAVFGNVGNFGIPIIRFRFPGDEQAIVAGTVYFIAISSTAFAVSVAAANWHKGSALRAVLAVFKTPALIAVPPALLVNWLGWGLPPIVVRPVELLADGWWWPAPARRSAARRWRWRWRRRSASKVSPAARACSRRPCLRRCWPRSSPLRTISSHPS
jgi:malate permease and related proteins